MSPLELSFLRKLIADQASSRKHAGVAARMVELEGLGQVVGAQVRYTAADHTRAANMLLSRNYPLQAPPEPGPRSAARGAGSEKTHALRVSDQLVAVVPIGMPQAIATPPGTFVAMHLRDALALPYEVLLVSENLEPLLQLHQYTWLGDFIKGRPTLAVFRGAPGYFRTDVAAELIRFDTRPTLAFFDFDPKGLSMAASLPRREALCLPPWPALDAEAIAQKRVGLFTHSFHDSRAHLDGVEDPAIRLAWQRLRRLAVGLNQEGFPR